MSSDEVEVTLDNHDQQDEIDAQIERERATNDGMPDTMTVDGVTYTNIRVRDVPLEENPENNGSDHPEENDQSQMAEIEAQFEEEKKEKLPERIEIDGQIFTNIRNKGAGSEEESQSTSSLFIKVGIVAVSGVALFYLMRRLLKKSH